MKRIALITLAGLTIFATAAVANQAGWGHGYQGNVSRMQQAAYTGGGCPMNANMMGQGMMNRNGMMGPGMRGTQTPGTSTGNWRTNPSYQGQGRTTPSGN